MRSSDCLVQGGVYTPRDLRHKFLRVFLIFCSSTAMQHNTSKTSHATFIPTLRTMTRSNRPKYTSATHRQRPRSTTLPYQFIPKLQVRSIPNAPTPAAQHPVLENEWAPNSSPTTEDPDRSDHVRTMTEIFTGLLSPSSSIALCSPPSTRSIVFEPLRPHDLDYYINGPTLPITTLVAETDYALLNELAKHLLLIQTIRPDSAIRFQRARPHNCLEFAASSGILHTISSEVPSNIPTFHINWVSPGAPVYLIKEFIRILMSASDHTGVALAVTCCMSIPNWKIIDVVTECGFSRLLNGSISDNQPVHLWFRHPSDVFTNDRYMRLVRKYLKLSLPERTNEILSQ